MRPIGASSSDSLYTRSWSRSERSRRASPPEKQEREKKDKDRRARRREMVDYTDYDGKYKGMKTSSNLGKANEKSNKWT